MLAGIGQTTRIVTDDSDDVLLILECKLLLDRIAVSGRHGDVVHPERVGDPPVGEKRQGLPRPGAIDPANAVVVPDPDAGARP